MKKIRGKLHDGISGFLEISEDTVILWAERGILSKELEKQIEFPISDVTSTQLKKNQTSFRQMYQLTIDYETETGKSEVIFLSEEKPYLDALINKIDDDIEKRRLAKEQIQAEQRRERKVHVHQITLLLEFIDQLFKILFELNGSVNWTLMKKHLSELEQIPMKMTRIDVATPLNYDIQNLSTSLFQRQTDEIKDDCYKIIVAIHNDAERLSQSEESSQSFNLDLYRLFVKSYLLLWDLNLSEYVGDGLDKDEFELMQASFESLEGLIRSEECSLGLIQLKELPLEKEFSVYFEDITSWIHLCLNSIVE